VCHRSCCNMSSTTTVKTHSKDAKPLPLSEILRDLAYTRVSDLDLSSLLPQSSAADVSPVLSDVDNFVAQSYEFVREAKAALKIHDRESAKAEGTKLEHIRSELEESVEAMGPSLISSDKR